MNYIIVRSENCKDQVKEISRQMVQPCSVLIKDKHGDWWLYDKSLSRSVRTNIEEYLNGDNAFINWGNHIFNTETIGKCCNKMDSVTLASNKRDARLFLQDKGISVPKTYANIEDIPYGCTVIARPAKHHAGSNFVVVDNTSKLLQLYHKVSTTNTHWYFSEVFPKTNEYRVHVAHGKILAIFEKKLGENIQDVNDKWEFLHWGEYNTTIVNQSIKACKVLGLDYGAVDVMIDEEGCIAITEVNTSPELTPLGITKHARYFDWWLGHTDTPHYKYNGTDLGKNIWKTFNI